MPDLKPFKPTEHRTTLPSSNNRLDMSVLRISTTIAITLDMPVMKDLQMAL
jgi:hypothetical protein